MSQEIQIYNTLTRSKERFTPRNEGQVSIYVCGVTPYDEAHLGHARPSVVFDVVRRFFEYVGYSVHLVQNFTDVDDKIIDRANARGISAVELAEMYSQRYLESMDRLGVRRAALYPKVSEHIQEIIAVIRALVENGSAYESEGSVLFSVSSFSDYGKLSKQRVEELLAGVRVESSDSKDAPLDFALWKAAKPDEPAWESPWGPGRPGWHIECSAMSLKYLGSGFDIHGGGLDLIFPHHENEIAQSEAYTREKPFVRYWMHNGLINFGNEKMSKSLGNFVTIDELVEEHGPSLVRYLILQQHYRSPMEFSPEQIVQARKGWERLNRAVQRIAALGTPLSLQEARAAAACTELVDRAEEAESRFVAAMADDFNTPAALAALFELIRDVRSQIPGDSREIDESRRCSLRAVYGVLERMGGEILGILTDESIEAERAQASGEFADALVQMILDVRDEARRSRDFATADKLRDRLGELGIVIEDTPQGSKWAFKK